jgi:hypothetical protein
MMDVAYQILCVVAVVIMGWGPSAGMIWIASFAFRKISLRETFAVVFFCAVIAGTWAAAISAK